MASSPIRPRSTHINSPIGGMGMNSGIHDAWFLSERLAEIMQGAAPDASLDEYAAVRREIAVEFIRAESHRNTEALGRQEAEVRAQRNAELGRIAADPKLVREYLLKSSMIASFKAYS